MNTFTPTPEPRIHEGATLKQFIKKHPKLNREKVAEAIGVSPATLDRRLAAPEVEINIFVAVHQISREPFSAIFA